MSKNMQKSVCYLLHAVLLLGSLFDGEDGAEISVEFQWTTQGYIPEDRSFPVAVMRRDRTDIGLSLSP
jgi:hypothetical protein